MDNLIKMIIENTTNAEAKDSIVSTTFKQTGPQGLFVSLEADGMHTDMPTDKRANVVLFTQVLESFTNGMSMDDPDLAIMMGAMSGMIDNYIQRRATSLKLSTTEEE